MPAGGSKRLKCDSFKVFERNLKRSRSFITLFGEENRSAGRPSNDELELLRGALVFSVGALDNFIHELILEIVPKFGGNTVSMRKPLADIAKADPGLALRVALARPDDGERVFREALEGWLEVQSFHGVTKIVGALNYLGVLIDESTLPASWKKDLDRFTEERHMVVHRGSTARIQRGTAIDCTDLIEKIAKAINSQAVKYYHG